MIMYDKNMIIYVYVKGLRKYVEGVCSDWIENNGTLNSQCGNKPKTQNSKPILSPLNPTQMSPFLSADLIALDQRGRGEGGRISFRCTNYAFGPAASKLKS